MRELTPMQAACWFGRSNEAILGGVSAHLYSEFDGQSIDLKKLNLAIQRLYQRHEMLRLRLDRDAIPSIISADQNIEIEVDDFSIFTKTQQKQKLETKRQYWTHQKLDLTQAQTVKFSISLLDEQHFRLHVDADMIAIDPSSFRILMEDLALFYEDADCALPPTADFFSWNNQLKHDPICQKQRSRDRIWWKSRLADIAPAPTIPLKNPTSTVIQSHRLSSTLNTEQRQALHRLAKQHRLTFSTLLMGIFAYCLGNKTQDPRYRLNVPTFWREPVMQGIESTIGDFANVSILNIDMSATDHLAQFCQNIGKTWIETLGHQQYSGVQVMRDLSRYHGTAQTAPIVFTAAVDLAGEELFSERVHQIFGQMNWTISQGPQVALDVQVVNVANKLLINWDIRLDALPESWINPLFENYIDLLKKIASDPDIFTQDLQSLSLKFPKQLINKRQSETVLNALQKAYLLGRTTAFPLGGIAMQEYREYEGRLDLEEFKLRLTDMVRHHPSLRTYIDEKKLLQYISDEVIVNLNMIDLTRFEQAVANEHISTFREQYRHALFDLNQSPWDVTVFKLSVDQFKIFVRFDAQILDGRAIASLMMELFSAQTLTQPNPDAKPNTITAQNRTDDQKYWQNKLANHVHIPKLPWCTPLDSIATSLYRRQSLHIDREKFQQLSKIGACKGLFKNSLIMALVLEILSQRTTDQTLAVGVPVLPLYDGAFSNQSTFIVSTWQQTANFVEHAVQLQKSVLESLQHLAFSGVDLARMLFEKYKSAPALPIVITNGLSWPSLPESNPIKYIDGLTQTPQVAIDVRFKLHNDGALIFDIDYAQAAISDQFITDFLLQLEKSIDQILALGLENVDLKLHFENTQTQINQGNMQREQILQIYLNHLNLPPSDATHQDMQFSHLGLRPSHLKLIAKQINETFEISLTPLQLIHCQDIVAVEKLISTHTKQTIH